MLSAHLAQQAMIKEHEGFGPKLSKVRKYQKKLHRQFSFSPLHRHVVIQTLVPLLVLLQIISTLISAMRKRDDCSRAAPQQLCPVSLTFSLWPGLVALQ